MKRENDLILSLLLQLEGDNTIDLSSYSEDQKDYHNFLIIEMGLAEGLSVQTVSGKRIAQPDQLTVRGHDYLDRHRESIEKIRKAQVRVTEHVVSPRFVKQINEDYDAFICHASEDKDEIVRSLVTELISRGLKIWYDEFSMTVGDSLRQSIEKGLAQSRYGIVIISKYFLNKHWPQKELNGLAQKEIDGVKVILPVWHKIVREDIAKQSPMLADRFAVQTSKGIKVVITELLKAMHIEIDSSDSHESKNESTSDTQPEVSELGRKILKFLGHDLTRRFTREEIAVLFRISPIIIQDELNKLKNLKFINQIDFVGRPEDYSLTKEKGVQYVIENNLI